MLFNNTFSKKGNIDFLGLLPIFDKNSQFFKKSSGDKFKSKRPHLLVFSHLFTKPIKKGILVERGGE